MSQKYEDISVNEYVYNSLQKLLDRDDTGATFGAGTSFPDVVEDWQVGKTCLRTDEKVLYYLSSVNPVKWDVIVDFSKPLATELFVRTLFQPLNKNLTALSQLQMSADKIPYFNSSSSMALLDVTSLGEKLMKVEDASGARDLLSVGALSTLDEINPSNSAQYITAGAITEDKLNFTPIKAGEGYTCGDIKESYNSDAEDGYIDLNKGYTIGSDAARATYKGVPYQNARWLLGMSTLTGDFTGTQPSDISQMSSIKKEIEDMGRKDIADFFDENLNGSYKKSKAIYSIYSMY